MIEIFSSTLSGIIVREQATALIYSNTINNNLEAAIVFFGTSGGEVLVNQYSGNRWRISVQDSANPTIGANNCQ